LAKKEEAMRFTGVIENVLGNSMFKVRLPNNHVVTAYIGGKMRLNTIRIVLGDTVDVEISPYDLTKARIVYRQK
jgi:translation initiation factor IF-1